MKKVFDITGKKFGKLTVLRQEYIKNHSVYWLCQCDCGKECVVKGDKIKSGHTKSCGCKKHEIWGGKRTHGETKTRLYAIWGGMITRCRNMNREKAKKDYQDRGIGVCPEWTDFSVFQAWALANGYSEDFTIDRIDNDKGYFPGNCRWADAKTQANNKRNNINLSFNNETHTVAQWAEIMDIKYGTLYNRILKGWNVEDALKTPIGERRSA
jgi:hypothetical protein